MCDVLLPPGVNPTAVKYIYHIILEARYLSVYLLDSSGSGCWWIIHCAFKTPNTITRASNTKWRHLTSTSNNCPRRTAVRILPALCGEKFYDTSAERYCACVSWRRSASVRDGYSVKKHYIGLTRPRTKICYGVASGEHWRFESTTMYDFLQCCRQGLCIPYGNVMNSEIFNVTEIEVVAWLRVFLVKSRYKPEEGGNIFRRNTATYRTVTLYCNPAECKWEWLAVEPSLCLISFVHFLPSLLFISNFLAFHCFFHLCFPSMLVFPVFHTGGTRWRSGWGSAL
jgi:hypothetical protein